VIVAAAQGRPRLIGVPPSMWTLMVQHLDAIRAIVATMPTLAPAVPSAATAAPSPERASCPPLPAPAPVAGVLQLNAATLMGRDRDTPSPSSPPSPSPPLSSRTSYAHPWPDFLPGLGRRSMGPFDICARCERWSWARYGPSVLCLSCAKPWAQRCRSWRIRPPGWPSCRHMGIVPKPPSTSQNRQARSSRPGIAIQRGRDLRANMAGFSDGSERMPQREPAGRGRGLTCQRLAEPHRAATPDQPRWS
jgi:hypothetical protein